MFRVGQKVVCVNDDFQHPDWAAISNKCKRGEVYTIRDIVPGWFDNGYNGVRLTEVKNAVEKWIGDPERSEVCFGPHRFRPLVERKTDISSLEALLLPNAKILEGV